VDHGRGRAQQVVRGGRGGAYLQGGVESLAHFCLFFAFTQPG
jgi:hypothetical protein